MFKKDIWKKRTVYIGVLSVLNMQKDSWNIINLCEILIIEYLQVMEFIPKEKMEIQIIMFAWWFLKDTRVQFLSIVYTPLLYVLLCSHHMVVFNWFIMHFSRSFSNRISNLRSNMTYNMIETQFVLHQTLNYNHIYNFTLNHDY